ncbi:MAG TPA: C-GCAxxG-C-C family protein [Terracidiphilus sp.]|nr:C-GCAxxG-C-C family protein [Terracidiphilus sp.]
MDMNNADAFRVMELGMQGYNCSQILMLLALEAQHKENPDLVRAMTGLVGGMSCGKNCGTLTAGCCLLGLYAGKGTPDANADDRLEPMLHSFVEWFESEFKPRYGGIDCAVILEDDARNRLARCPSIMLESLAKLKEILAENGYAFAA